MSQETSKHVQTELTEREYEAFREFATEQGLSIKEAGREALLDWVQRQRRPDPSDPAFTVLEELDDLPPASVETDAREEDDLVEEWSGDDVSFALAEHPPERDES
jgi:hypothetical protein